MPGTTAQPRHPGHDDHALDLLSDVLGLLRLRAEVLCWSELGAPWGLRFAPDDALLFHVVQRGRCLLHVDGDKRWHEVDAGDLVVLPEGCGHRLVSTRDAQAIPIEQLVGDQGGVGQRLRSGGGGSQVHVLCGRFRFDELLRRGVLPGLPDVLHVRARSAQAPPWLAPTVRLLGVEARHASWGRDIALARLADLLFVQTLRAWLATTGDRSLKWLGAARDPRIASAVTRIHRSPERPWDVASLAAEAGMSRSKFAERFTALVGEPPTRYLTKWRMHFAARLLRGSGENLATIALAVGYDSEAAFNRAFKRLLRVSPGEFRRRSPP